MIELERNNPVDAVALSEFFARCGWVETDAAVKLEWALAASDDWVVCKVDGEMIGFGRACRLSPLRRVVFDLVVDPRFRGIGLRAEIARLLTESAGRLEEVSVFSESWTVPLGHVRVAKDGAAMGASPVVSGRPYLGTRSATPAGED